MGVSLCIDPNDFLFTPFNWGWDSVYFYWILSILFPETWTLFLDLLTFPLELNILFSTRFINWCMALIFKRYLILLLLMFASFLL